MWFLTDADQNLFLGIIQGNTLAPVLDQVVAKWKRSGPLHFSKSVLQDGSTSFFLFQMDGPSIWELDFELVYLLKTLRDRSKKLLYVIIMDWPSLFEEAEAGLLSII